MQSFAEIAGKNGRPEALPGLSLRRVAGRIGAVIEGVDLSGAPDVPTMDAVREAVMVHKVVFFRDQHAMDDGAMEALTERLGEPIVHPNAGAMAGSRFLTDLDADTGYASSIWHTDLTFMPAYASFAVLRPVALPDYGGDTMWANCASAYQDLPPELKALADGLHGLHTNEYQWADLHGDESASRMTGLRAGEARRVFEAEHPVVRVHEETGERALVIGDSFFRRFIGYDIRRSNRLRDFFQAYITSPENTVRWQWRLGDVAIWDNRSTQHRVVADFGEQPRKMRRAAAHGTLPEGVDGFRSRALT